MKGNTLLWFTFKKVSLCFTRCYAPSSQFLPEGKRCISGASSGEFTLWSGHNFNFETNIQVAYFKDIFVRGIVCCILAVVLIIKSWLFDTVWYLLWNWADIFWYILNCAVSLTRFLQDFDSIITKLMTKGTITYPGPHSGARHRAARHGMEPQRDVASHCRPHR